MLYVQLQPHVPAALLTLPHLLLQASQPTRSPYLTCCCCCYCSSATKPLRSCSLLLLPNPCLTCCSKHLPCPCLTCSCYLLQASQHHQASCLTSSCCCCGSGICRQSSATVTCCGTATCYGNGVQDLLAWPCSHVWAAPASPAASSISTSSGLTVCPVEARCAAAVTARCAVPTQCPKRECSALGNTQRVQPSWARPLKRCTAYISMHARQSDKQTCSCYATQP
jgi:hypothetical protein